MPQTIGLALISAAASTGVAALGAVGAFLFTNATLISFVAAVGVGQIQRKKAERKAREAAIASLRDRIITVRGAIEPRRLILGRARAGGVVAFVGSTGTNKETLAMVVVLAGHECESIDEVWFNDERVDLDGSGNVTTARWMRQRKESRSHAIVGGSSSYVVTDTPIDAPSSIIAMMDDESQHVATSVSGNTIAFGSTLPAVSGRIHYQTNVGTPRARVFKHLGHPSQLVDGQMAALFPEQWTADHRLRGCCYLVVLFDFDFDVFPNGPPNVSAVVKGLKCYDPRNGLTVWTENPALLVRAFALHPLGGRLPASAINDTDVIVAANVCDTQVDYSTWGQLVDEGGDFIVTETGDQIIV